MTAAQQEPARIAALDGVRGIAILLVLVMHGLYIGPLLDPTMLDSGYARIALLGWCGVDVFFVLSGFLITGILLRSKGSGNYFRNFYVRRTLRIFPLYYVVVVLLLYVLPRPGLPVDGQVAHLLYYQNWWFGLVRSDVNFPLKITWSLAIEEQFYLLWPALVLVTSKRGLARICAGTIAGAIALRFVLLGNGFEHTHLLTPCRMDALAAGALLAVVPPPRAWLGAVAVVLGVTGLVATAVLGGASIPESIPQQRWGLLAALSLGVGLLITARSARVLGPLFRFAPLRSLGKYSYCIYLTHMLVIEWLGGRVLSIGPANLRELTQNVPPLVIVLTFTLAAILCTWALAFTSWHLFEKHLLHLKRHFPAYGTR